MVSKKLLIAFEGIDGSGKTTQILLLKAELDRLFYLTTITKAKQPSQDKAFARFLESFEISSDSIAFMFLYQALHSKQFDKTLTALESNHIVLADRWNGSFFVYHSTFEPLAKRSKNVLSMLDKLAFQDLKPDITFLLDVPPQVSFQRRKRRGENENFDGKSVDFYRAICEKYNALAVENNWLVIDGTLPIEDVHGRIWNIVMNRLGQ